MNNPLVQLMEKYRKKNRSAFHLGPFLPLKYILEKNLPFNGIMRNSVRIDTAVQHMRRLQHAGLCHPGRDHRKGQPLSVSGVYDGGATGGYLPTRKN